MYKRYRKENTSCGELARRINAAVWPGVAETVFPVILTSIFALKEPKPRCQSALLLVGTPNVFRLSIPMWSRVPQRASVRVLSPKQMVHRPPLTVEAQSMGRAWYLMGR